MRIGICTNFLTEDRYSMHEELWEKIRSHADFIEFPAFPLMEMSDDEFILFLFFGVPLGSEHTPVR